MVALDCTAVFATVCILSDQSSPSHLASQVEAVFAACVPELQLEGLYIL